jgi:hypothetical protein
MSTYAFYTLPVQKLFEYVIKLVFFNITLNYVHNILIECTMIEGLFCI